MTNQRFIELTSGDYRVVLSPLGAALVKLNYQGLDYCPQRDAADLVPRYHGSVIAPWANRIRDGQYQFRGVNYQVPVNEVGLNNSLHGLSAETAWEVAELSEQKCVFRSVVGEIDGYPWRIELSAEYRLTEDGLQLSFSAKNTAGSPAPFGWAFHPYFQLPNQPSEYWKLKLPATKYVEVDERLLPISVRPVSAEFDFTAGSACCIAGLDHAFGGFSDSTRAVASLYAEGSRTLEISWDSSCPWVQLHFPPSGVKTIVIEPQSAPPDAFNSDFDATALAPLASYGAEISIRVK